MGPKGTNGTKSASFIGEEFSQADYLKKKTVASGLNEMNTEAQFSGIARLTAAKKTQLNSSTNEAILFDEYIGKYNLTRKITMTGVARFDQPHLTVTKVGKAEPASGTFVDYVITVANDGNQALGPVYVQDFFPPGADYVSSSLRPAELAATSAQWTLTNLGIGVSTQIDLKLNMTETMDSIVNRVQAKGYYADQWVGAENYSAIQLNWLSCCPPQLLVAKEPMLVHYRIYLKNRENSIMAATITDQLPEGMMFQNSSVGPSDRRTDTVIWNLIDLQPGEIRIIDYWARAVQSGTYVNTVHVDANYLTGVELVSADAVCSVNIGGGAYLGSGSGWQPPGCFGLNCTQQAFGDDWVPCYACGATEPQLLDSVCPSCPISTVTEGGDDIP